MSENYPEFQAYLHRGRLRDVISYSFAPGRQNTEFSSKVATGLKNMPLDKIYDFDPIKLIIKLYNLKYSGGSHFVKVS